MMRVGYDYRSAVLEGITGIGRYTLELARALVRRRDPELELILFANRVRGRAAPLTDTGAGLGRHRIVAARFPGKVLRLLRPLIDVQTFTGPVDLFHFTDFSRPPLRRGTPSIATLHDVSFLVSPDFHRVEDREALTRMTDDTLRRCRLVLTDSASARNDLLRHRPDVDPERVRAVPLAAEERFFRSSEGDAEGEAAARDRVRSRYRLPQHFLLSVGTIEPRKNHARLVRAVGRCHDPLPLVLVGRRGWLVEGYLEALAEARIEVIEAGHVADADLPLLYRSAEVLVYPSLCEGFGLPVIEGMASGVPVVTSNRSSMREVAGAAAVLVDPEDEADIAAGIDRARRESEILCARGPAQARRFSWERCADETRTAFSAALTASP